MMMRISTAAANDGAQTQLPRTKAACSPQCRDVHITHIAKKPLSFRA